MRSFPEWAGYLAALAVLGIIIAVIGMLVKFLCPNP